MRALVAEAGLDGAIEVHSAGTGDWHRGEPPDERARAEARRRGIDLTSRASTFLAGDAAFYDLVLAMDRSNLDDLIDRTADPALHDRIRLLRTFDPDLDDHDPYDGDVPDPWFGDDDGFVFVFDMLTASCTGLLEHVRSLIPR